MNDWPPDCAKLTLDDVSTWKMLIGAELNCLAAVRGYVAGVMASRVPTSLMTVLRECANHTSLAASELIEAKPQTLQKWIRRAITTLWLWKTGVNPVEETATEWHDLINRFSREKVWTRSTIYSQREKLIETLAKSLVGAQVLSQPVGLGPQVFEMTRTQTSLVSTRRSQFDTTIVTSISHQDIVPEVVRQTGAGPSGPSEKPFADAINLYLKHVLPPAPTYVPEEWSTIIALSAQASRLFIQGSVGSGKTHLLHALGQELKQTNQVPLYVRASDYARQAADMDILQFAATKGAFWQTFKDEALSQEFAKALAEAQRADRVGRQTKSRQQQTDYDPVLHRTFLN